MRTPEHIKHINILMVFIMVKIAHHTYKHMMMTAIIIMLANIGAGLGRRCTLYE